MVQVAQLRVRVSCTILFGYFLIAGIKKVVSSRSTLTPWSPNYHQLSHPTEYGHHKQMWSPNRRVVAQPIHCSSRPTNEASRPTANYKTLKLVILSHFFNKTIRVLWRENKINHPASGHHHCHHHLLRLLRKQ